MDRLSGVKILKRISNWCKRMHIAVYIGGASNGFDTPLSGESRYAYNLSSMLVKFGHRVDCIGTGNSTHERPQWGSQKPIEGITFKHPSEVGTSIVYDVAINVPWEHQKYDLNVEGRWGPVENCLTLDLKARLYLHTSFLWGPKFDALLTKCYEAGHVVVHPYPSNAHVADTGRKFAFLPFPFCEDVLNEVTNVEERNSVVWTCKYFYSDAWVEDEEVHYLGKKILGALKRVCNDLNKKCYFIDGKSFFSKKAERLGITKIIKGITNKEIFPALIKKSELDGLLYKSRFIPLMPNYGGSCLDAVCLGTIPVAFKDQNLYTYSGIIKDSCFFDGESTEMEMEEVFYKLFIDDYYYKVMAERIVGRAAMFTYKSSYEHFLYLIGEFYR